MLSTRLARTALGAALMALLPLSQATHGAGPTTTVQASGETAPVPSSDDAADDPAVWVHPTDPSLSLVIGTDKNAGVGTYNLDGTQEDFYPFGDWNNVDVRYDFLLGGDFVDIVAAGNRTDQSIDVYRVDPVTRDLIDVTAGPLPIGIAEAYGFCLYRSWITGKTYAIVNDKDGEVEQFELVDNGSGLIDAVLVRTFSVGGQTEGMVADDQYAQLYIGEEAYGIWRYGAEPTDGTARVEVDVTGGPHLTEDVEGLSIYYTGDGGGYLLASSQGDNTYAVYERVAAAGVPNAWLKNFEIITGVVGGCEETDGIDVTSVALGPLFPQGVFVAQDGVNSPANQNYKLVPWPAIATTGAQQLVVDTTWDPRHGPGDDLGACCLGGGACNVLSQADCAAQAGDYQGNGTGCGGGTCDEPMPPGPATSPSPADGAVDVSTDADLAWSAGALAESHDVYFGTDPTPDATEFQGNQAGTTFDPGPLASFTTYYWRIDEVNTDGVTTGAVWSFMTVDVPQPPGPATNPDPADGTNEVALGADLSWTAGALADSHDVYFGTDATPDGSEFQGNQGATTFDPGPLDPTTVYYWRIDEVNTDGTTVGTVWSFTTADRLQPPGQATNPSPADDDTEVNLRATLAWSAGALAKSHDVYFGTDSTPDAGEFQGNQPGTTFDPGPLDAATTYYWRVDEVNGDGTTDGVVWSFTTVDEAQLPGQASNPDPADGAVAVSLRATLSWAAGAFTDSHDVYFGTDSTPDATEFQGNQGATTFDPGPLDPSTTYYWRINEVNGDGTTVGPVWSFTTDDQLEPPGPATNPSPADGATGTSLNAVLSWTAGALADSHDVFFGTDATPDAGEFQGNQAGTTFDPGPLTLATTYYWRIDERNEAGVTQGPVWSFTTVDTVGPLEFLSVSTFTTNGGGSFEIDKPEGTSEGDFLLMVVCKDQAGEVDTPGGWDVVDEGTVRSVAARIEVFSKIAGPDEPDAYAVTASQNNPTFASILRYCCTDPANPVDAVNASEGASSTPTAPSVTPSVANAMIVRLFGATDTELAPDPYPAGHDGRFALDGGSQVSGAGADTIHEGPGSSGSAQFSLNSAQVWRAITIALAPGPGGPGPGCAADVDGDQTVGVQDLVEVIVHWGESGGPADVNGDGTVTVLDLVEVVVNWGPCP